MECVGISGFNLLGGSVGIMEIYNRVGMCLDEKYNLFLKCIV